MGWVPGAHSNLFRITSDIRFKSPPVHLHWEIETKWSASRDWAIWTAAMWNDDTLMHAMCFGLAFILVRKRSIKLMAMKNTSDGRSYHTFRHLSTCADPSRAPIVISSFCKKKKVGKIISRDFFSKIGTENRRNYFLNRGKMLKPVLTWVDVGSWSLGWYLTSSTRASWSCSRRGWIASGTGKPDVSIPAETTKNVITEVITNL